MIRFFYLCHNDCFVSNNLKQKTQFALKSTFDSVWGSFLTCCCCCCFWWLLLLLLSLFPFCAKFKNFFQQKCNQFKKSFSFQRKKHGFDFGCCQMMMTYSIRETTRRRDRISFSCGCAFSGHFNTPLRFLYFRHIFRKIGLLI